MAFKDEATPYRAGGYDPKAAEEFYAKRWALKFGRIAQLVGILGGWGIGLLRDRYEYGGIGSPGNKWEQNMPMRAKQILAICTRLGTTANKIGQALSIRGDILPAPYVKELRSANPPPKQRTSSLNRCTHSSTDTALLTCGVGWVGFAGAQRAAGPCEAISDGDS